MPKARQTETASSATAVFYQYIGGIDGTAYFPGVPTRGAHPDGLLPEEWALVDPSIQTAAIEQQVYVAQDAVPPLPAPEPAPDTPAASAEAAPTEASA